MTRSVLVLALVAACGHRDTPPSGQQRIVTLTPSATEVVAALGAQAQLVGVDQYSEYPASVKALPKVGSFLAPNLEAIVQLKPTFVIVDDIHAETAGALHDAGIQTIDFAMHAMPDLKGALTTVGRRIGRAHEASVAIADIEVAIDAAAARKPAHHPRVLAVIDREAGGLGNLVAVGPGSWLDELLAVVGGDNILAASGVRYPKVSQEEILRGAPEVILDLSQARGDLAPWQQVHVPATDQHRVRALDPFISRPSPRVAEALDALAAALRP